MSQILPKTKRTDVKRVKQRANYDLAAIYKILDQSLFATIAFSDGENVHAIPMTIWREEEYLYIHGSNGSRLLKKLQEGIQVCVSATLARGLVLARSAPKHSINYDSVCIYGVFEAADPKDKYSHMQRFMEHWHPGRWQFVRPPDDKEIAALSILRIAITEAVSKSREGGPQDYPEDLDQPVWAGVLPLQMQWRPGIQEPEQKNAQLAGAP